MTEFISNLEISFRTYSTWYAAALKRGAEGMILGATSLAWRNATKMLCTGRCTMHYRRKVKLFRHALSHKSLISFFVSGIAQVRYGAQCLHLKGGGGKKQCRYGLCLCVSRPVLSVFCRAFYMYLTLLQKKDPGYRYPPPPPANVAREGVSRRAGGRLV